MRGNAWFQAFAFLLVLFCMIYSIWTKAIKTGTTIWPVKVITLTRSNCMKIVFCTAALTIATIMVSSTAFAEDPAPTICKKEIETFCRDVKLGEGRRNACLLAHMKELSTECQQHAKQNSVAAGNSTEMPNAAPAPEGAASATAAAPAAAAAKAAKPAKGVSTSGSSGK